MHLIYAILWTARRLLQLVLSYGLHSVLCRFSCIKLHDLWFVCISSMLSYRLHVAYCIPVDCTQLIQYTLGVVLIDHMQLMPRPKPVFRMVHSLLMQPLLMQPLLMQSHVLCNHTLLMQSLLMQSSGAIILRPHICKMCSSLCVYRIL